MTKTLEVFRFEFGYQLRRASTVFYIAIVFAICAGLMQVMAGGSRDDGSFNSPFTLMVITVFGSMLALVMIAGFAGDAASRDADLRADALFYTSPVGRSAYVLGRFLGAFAMSAMLLLAFPAGSMIATQMPWVDPASLVPFRLSAYLAPYFLYALPNAFIATAILFAAALSRRRATASYAAAAFLFFTALICGKLLAPRLGTSVAALLDPLGFTTLNVVMLSLTAAQKNTFVLAIDDALLMNRLLWLGIAGVVLAAAYARFRFAHHAVRHQRTELQKEIAEPIEPRHAQPIVRRVFDASTRLRQLRAITMRSFAELHTSRAWWIVPLLAIFFVLQAPALAGIQLGVPGPLTTARLVGFLTGDVSVWFTVLIALSAGELVWREREARMHALADVTPAPDWLPVAGKFLGLALMLAAALTIFLIAGVAVQTIYGAERYDFKLYVQLLYGLLLPEYLLTAALAMVVHVVVNQKYVANVVIVLIPIARDLVRRLGVEDNLLLYGSLPEWTHSEISGFGPSTEARLWFTGWFAGWALLFGLATYLFRVRGEEGGLRRRIALARSRVKRTTMIAGATALAIMAGTGGFIFYNTHVRRILRRRRRSNSGARHSSFDTAATLLFPSRPSPRRSCRSTSIRVAARRRFAGLIASRTGAARRSMRSTSSPRISPTPRPFPSIALHDSHSPTSCSTTGSTNSIPHSRRESR